MMTNNELRTLQRRTCLQASMKIFFPPDVEVEVVVVVVVVAVAAVFVDFLTGLAALAEDAVVAFLALAALVVLAAAAAVDVDDLAMVSVFFGLLVVLFAFIIFGERLFWGVRGVFRGATQNDP